MAQEQHSRDARRIGTGAFVALASALAVAVALALATIPTGCGPSCGVSGSKHMSPLDRAHGESLAGRYRNLIDVYFFEGTGFCAHDGEFVIVDRDATPQSRSDLDCIADVLAGVRHAVVMVGRYGPGRLLFAVYVDVRSDEELIAIIRRFKSLGTVRLAKASTYPPPSFPDGPPVPERPYHEWPSASWLAGSDRRAGCPGYGE